MVKELGEVEDITGEFGVLKGLDRLRGRGMRALRGRERTGTHASANKKWALLKHAIALRVGCRADQQVGCSPLQSEILVGN